MSDTEQKHTVPEPVKVPYVNAEIVTIYGAIAGLYEAIGILMEGGE